MEIIAAIRGTLTHVARRVRASGGAARSKKAILCTNPRSTPASLLPAYVFGLLLFTALVSGPIQGAAATQVELQCPRGLGDPSALEVVLKKVPANSANAKVASLWISKIENVLLVYARLSRLSGRNPGIVLCGSSDLNAFSLGADSPIFVTMNLLRRFGNDPDMLAFVIAHEFGHLALGHAKATEREMPYIVGSAIAMARNIFAQTGDVQRARRVRAIEEKLLFGRYRREQEKQADDYGTMLMGKAGYNPDAAERFMLQMLKITGYERTALFRGHPGWLERIASDDPRVTDATFEQVARTLTDGKHWRELARKINEWLQLLPDSPDAWYFKAQFLQRIGNMAYVASYENMKSDNTPSFFGTTAQNDQSWLALCIGLVKEDHKLEAAYCSRHLQTEADRDEFRRAFGGYLLVGGAAPREPNLQVIKDGNRHRFITNDLSLLRVKHLKPSPIPPAWHALRFPPEESDVPLSVR